MGTVVRAATETQWLVGVGTHSPWPDPSGGSRTLSRSLCCPLYVVSFLSFASGKERGLVESGS